MKEVQLPLTATAQQISAALDQVQVRCRSGLAFHDLAEQVREQLDRGERAARALGVTLVDLGPSLSAWPTATLTDVGSTVTRVEVRYTGITVSRGGVPSVSNNTLHLSVYPRGKRPWYLDQFSAALPAVTDLEPGEVVPMTGEVDRG